MMSMTFEVSSSVTLLFDFWNVRGPGGMLLSVLVVFLLTVLYEALKVWRVNLGGRLKPAEPYAAPTFLHSECISTLERSFSESSVTPIASQPSASNTRDSWLLHGLQTVLHMIQVTLGYMLMLCVMSYNVWIFLGVIVGSALGFFISFPLLGQM
ncbi:probable low affinity copper uptake protein 2 isoform X1 [Scophthalmus maximus]|uniref:probable low affinity copper uptake protein 2 isoform X1 n=2 Tax=Scophthalmus maximus TaxID=52904 RepID=UPI0015E099D6|nr:probable low affinity copper uptake protein 2 isoform X1 [Scophthalmus maximus]